MDSTSKLLSRLDLSTSSPPEDKDIVHKETDIIEETNAPSWNPRRGSSRNAHTDDNDIEQQRRRARLMQLINDTLETERSSNAQDEVLECEQDKVFNGAAKRTGSYHHRHKGSWRKKGKEQFPVFDGGNFVMESKIKRGGFVSGRGPFERDVPWEDQGQRRMVHHGYSAPHNSARGQISSDAGYVCGRGVSDIDDGETHSPFTKISNKDKMLEVDSPSVSRHETGQRHQRWPNCDSLPKNTGSRWQVQNGSTSHYNKTRAKNAAKDYGFGTSMHGDLLDGNLSHQHIVSPDREGRHPDKKEGKMILVDDIFRGGLNVNSELSSDRPYSLERKEVTFTVDDDNAFISSDDVAGRSYDHRSKYPLLPSEDCNSISKIEEGTSVHLSDPRPKNTLETRNYFNLVDDSPDIKTSHRLNQSVVQVPSDLENGSSRGDRRRRQFLKGKRKCNSFYSNYGGSSSSAFENSETSYHQSSMHVRYNRPSMTDYQRHGEIFDPVMEVDEPQSPEERFNYIQEQTIRVPDYSNARTSQIESDEILARQLQEQFYYEVAGSAVTEEILTTTTPYLPEARSSLDYDNLVSTYVQIDATIEWSLQQEDTQLAAASASSGQLDHEQEESMAHLHAYYSQLPYRNSSTRCSNHAQSLTSNRRRNFYGSEIDLEMRMMAEVRNFTGMDSGMRRDFLEALEAAFDQSNDALAESHHDFNENDYDMLLALDENNLNCTGASESQINSLPQSVVQSNNVEEACAICLESPSYGDIIRHLPCLHKFHRECIDAWLQRKALCPVCKSEIT